MSERWAVDMVEAIRDGKGMDRGGGLSLVFAKVNTASPLSIAAYDQVIDQQVYINPAYTLEADDNIDQIELTFQGAPGPDRLFKFLKDYHKKSVIKKGDTVIVLQTGLAFYILAKVAET